MAVGSFFFSAAPTAQNSPELHFRFINSFIQPTRVGSLLGVHPQILANQLTLSQPRGADYAHQIILAPRIFRPSDGPDI